MDDARTGAVRQAIVLAAGNGDRFHNNSPHSKLLSRIGGTPLLIRTLNAARHAGITDAHVILGYDADRVRAVALANAPVGLALQFHMNPDWRQENGLSVLAARSAVDHGPFALMMGDHLFEPQVLRRMLDVFSGPDEMLLCIDRQCEDPETLREATKVTLQGDRISAIGKTLDPFDALDTGLFVCRRSIFDALEAACADGDSTLSGGVARLAARGLVRGFDIGAARWCDVDTLADLATAERLIESALAR